LHSTARAAHRTRVNTSTAAAHAKTAANMHSPQQQQQAAELDAALEAIGVGRSHALLATCVGLVCVGLVWAGDAAEVMVLSFLGPAVSEWVSE
jgi:hypothetical protein